MEVGLGFAHKKKNKDLLIPLSSNFIPLAGGCEQ